MKLSHHSATRVFCYVLTFLTSTVHAQFNASFKMLADAKREGKHNPICFGFDENGYYTYSTTKTDPDDTMEKFMLEHCDKDGNKLKRSTIELKYNGKDANFEYIRYRNESLEIISSFLDKKTSEVLILMQLADNKTLALKPDVKIIHRIPSRHIFKLSFATDQKNENLFLFYDNSHKEPPIVKLADEISGVIWDKNLNEIFRASAPLASSYFNISYISFNNNGDMHIVLKKYNSKDADEYKIYSFYSSKKQFIQFDIPKNTKKIIDMNIIYSTTNEPMIFGLYSDSDPKKKDYKNKSKGYFAVQLSKSGFNASDIKYYTFSKNSVESFIGKSKIDEDLEIEYLDIHNLVLTEDNNFFIIVQKTFVRNQLNAYGSIFIIKTNSSGDPLWEKTIYKSAELEDRQFNTLIGNALVLLHVDAYNDLNMGKRALISTQFMQDGSIKQEAIIDNKHFESNPATENIYKINNSSLIVYGEKRVRATVQSAIISYK
jgi:hypothetical protein